MFCTATSLIRIPRCPLQRVVSVGLVQNALIFARFCSKLVFVISPSLCEETFYFVAIIFIHNYMRLSLESIYLVFYPPLFSDIVLVFSETKRKVQSTLF